MGKKILTIPQIRALMKKGIPMIFGTDLLQSFYEYGQEALKMTMEMNNKYHTPEEVRELFSELIARKVNKDCLILPPFYTEFGKNIKLGKKVFINTCCHFQDNGGIEIGDNSIIGAASVVTKDVPANTLAYGVPCKNIRKIC